MANAWPIVTLGRVLQQRKEFVGVDDLQTYKRCRVQLHAQGVVIRDVVTGAQIKTKKQQVCRAGEFLVAECNGRRRGRDSPTAGADQPNRRAAILLQVGYHSL